MTRSDDETLKSEGRQVTRMLKGKVVKVVHRHRAGEVLIEFEDGCRLFVDAKGDQVELSITG